LFKPISPNLNITLFEEGILRFWKRYRIFDKSSQRNPDGPEFVFYEGPPTANGLPGVHHAPARAFKDIFPRYKLMRGYHVSRRGGWDTHGLPVEIDVEKKLGFTQKSQIESYGIARFNELCRQSAFEYIQEWERFSERLGYWVDLQNAYVTFTNDYIQSVWWILKTFWERDLLYQGYKVVPFCPRCGTPLSDHEVALGYSETEDPSIYVRLPLVDEPGTSLLVWTTTPWTLPGNVAVAAHPDIDYVTVERLLPEGGSERLILARRLVASVFKDEPVEIIDSYNGKRLRGKRYKPLFTFLPVHKKAYHVVMQDYVTIEDGTGLVHTAPAFGAEDMQAALDYDLPMLMPVTDAGTFIPAVRPWSGMFVKEADPYIIQDLQTRGLLFRAGTLTHTYPFCWRCDTPLLYYARGTWFIRTSQDKDKLVELNQRINWVPGHIKDGRFGNWLENNVDWALGRERFWGTPLPIWECEDCHHQLMVASIAELSQLSGRDLTSLDLHRPAVDEILLPCPECAEQSGGKMQRVPELIDVWFDSGSMPVAQWHYPYENQDIFQDQHPADFICEGVDQTRGWFYSLHAISALLFESECYRNVICLGLFLDANGQKMSKSRGNYIDPWDVFNIHGADALRWYLYTGGPPWSDRRFSVDQVGEVVRNFTLMLWNVYSFFVTYANLDEWTPNVGQDAFLSNVRQDAFLSFTPQQPASGQADDSSYHHLDTWLRSELHTLIREVTFALENYDVTGATRPIQRFVDTLSKWYLRRSRRRFWKSESDDDKHAAYTTLYEALVTLSKLLAPSMPFLAEELHQNLVRSIDPDAPESVHLGDWPDYVPSLIDENLNQEMALVMKLASLGHAARNTAAIKVRQPLAEVSFSISKLGEERVISRYANLLADELNVKLVRVLSSTEEAVSYTLNPLPRQLGQKYKSSFPKIRRAILALDPDVSARDLLAGESVRITVDGIDYDIQPDEVEVRAEAHAGLTVASDGPYLAALTTDLTPELVSEGLAREFVRRVQELRKRAELDVADRITTWWQAEGDLGDIFVTWGDYIKAETLTTELVNGDPPADAYSETHTVDKQELVLSVKRNR